ncbi:DUF2254 family protein [Stakelama marina]|uniref:DUF2254 domain-containing protein n=1 Tax=Stakelama marina TaxID=2826939 RepID=A0A8T4IF93_9SPHN|nr:DUF2254 family protein [Stakelama marina]MBR0553230.1 DUF2254 domain-containing protein [Stakelama marina]
MASHPQSPRRWIAALLWRSYWGMATAMVVASLPLVALLLRLDSTGASQALTRIGWPFDFSAHTAETLASALATIYGALVTLYFSISLLVLTLAAGNLGVRLIDRWISRRTTRITLGLLLAGLSWAILALLAVDPEHGQAARLTITTLALATVPLLCWLSYALHDLGRTIHIDTAITALGKDAAADAQPFDDAVETGRAPDWDKGVAIRARQEGYVEVVALPLLTRLAAKGGGLIRIETEVGAHVMAGDLLATAIGCDRHACDDAVEAFAIGDFRSASQGAVFYVRLLVEIAARALSAAVNDFYTARACVDALGPVMVAHGRLPQGALWLHDDDGAERVLVRGDRFRGLFDAPLHALRQSAASYPAVATRLLEVYRRVLARDLEPAAAELIAQHLDILREHALGHAETATDRDAIRNAAQA